MTGLAAAFGLLAGVVKRARDRRRHGRRHVALRRRAAQPQLPRHLVPERRHGAPAARRAAATRAWCRASSTAPGTAGSSSCATRRSSGRCSRRSSAIRSGSPTPSSHVFAQRLENRDRVTRLLDDALMQAPTATWIERLAGKVPVAPVFDIAQALENPFVHERDGVLDFATATVGGARMIANPIRYRRRRLAAPRGAAHGRARRCDAARGRLRRGGDRAPARARRHRRSLGRAGAGRCRARRRSRRRAAVASSASPRPTPTSRRARPRRRCR